MCQGIETYLFCFFFPQLVQWCKILVPVMHFLRMALSGIVYRLMPEKLADHMGLYFPFILNVTENSYSIFSYQWQCDDTAKELFWLVAHINCNLLCGKICFILNKKKKLECFKYQEGYVGEDSDWLLFVYSTGRTRRNGIEF